MRDIVELGGGTQNVMLRFRRGDRALVLRRGPLHLRPDTNDAIRREVRMLAALRDSAVPHAHLVAACEDGAPLGGAAFYVMDAVDGFNPTNELPKHLAGDPTFGARLGGAAVEALLTLATVDPAHPSLDGIGRTTGYLERQVPRWLSELAKYASVPGYASSLDGGVETVTGWLEDRRPATFTPGVVHGDFHLANLMCAPDGGRVAAIVDWEMCTVGEPLLDFGWLLSTWPGAGDSVDELAAPLRRAGALPTVDDLIADYARQSSRDLSNLAWYRVLAAFKLSVILEGTYVRSLQGKATEVMGQKLHRYSVDLIARAVAVIEAGS
jgi:aminoglycoside phosphotransferase (APT) family kinase protein